MARDLPVVDGATAYSTLAPQYDDMAGQNRLLLRGRRRSLAILRATMPPGRLLELGCGTGEEAVDVARSVGARVVACDPAPAMVERARARATEAGAAVEIECATASAALESHRRQGAHFDGAWASFALAYDAPLRELRAPLASVLKSGAPLVISLPNVITLSAPWRIPARARDRYFHKVGGRRVRILATTPRATCTALAPDFRLVHYEGMSVLAPAAKFWRAWRLLGPVGGGLEWLDSRLASRRPWRSLGDHTIYVFRRVGP